MNETRKAALDDLRRELEDALLRHSELEKRIAKLRLTITSLEQLSATENLTDSIRDWAKGLFAPAQEMGITDLIREILKATDRPLIIREIKAELLKHGFDESRYKNLSGAIPIVIKRLRGQGEVETVRRNVGDKTITAFTYIPTEKQRRPEKN